MRLIKLSYGFVLFTALSLIVGSCDKTETDPCLKTKWPQPKEFEIKLVVRVLPTNPILPGSTLGSQNPEDFEKMMVNGTILKVNCADTISGYSNLGNSYITMGIDLPAPVDVSDAYAIGHVIYVYEFGNDNDFLNVNLAITITMKDQLSYTCNVTHDIYSPQILQMPAENYYYILLDIYSENWAKI
jgi:hypothetical protein